jgi:hypothetical protein
MMQLGGSCSPAGWVPPLRCAPHASSGHGKMQHLQQLMPRWADVAAAAAAAVPASVHCLPPQLVGAPQ